MDKETYIEQLKALVDKKNADEEKRIKDFDAEQRRRLPLIEKFENNSGKYMAEFDNISASICRGENKSFSFSIYEKDMAQFLQYRKYFIKKVFSCIPNIDISKPLEENISTSLTSFPLFHSKRCSPGFQDIWDSFCDAVLLLGKKAYQMKSLVYSRLVSVICSLRIDFCALPDKSKDEAEFITKELSECYSIVKTEMLLMPNEMNTDAIYPQANRSCIDWSRMNHALDQNQNEWNTEECRNEAFLMYKFKNADILPNYDSRNSDSSGNSAIKDMIDNFVCYINLMETCEIPNPRLFIDNTNLLKRILTADLYVRYYQYTDDGGLLESKEFTDEEIDRQILIEHMEKFIMSCTKRANEINSCSYRDWAQIYGIFMPRDGLFIKYSDCEIFFEHQKVSEFVSLMQSALERLWADDDIYKRENGMRDIQSVSVEKINSDAKGSIAGAVDKTKMAEDISKLATPPRKAREDVINVIKRVLHAGIDEKIKGVHSIPQAIKYLRRDLGPNEPFYDESVWVKDYVANYAASKNTKNKDGVNSVWNSLRRQCSSGSKKSTLKSHT